MYLVMETGHDPRELPAGVLVLGAFDDAAGHDDPSTATYRLSVASHGGNWQEGDQRDRMGGYLLRCPDGITVCLRNVGTVMSAPVGLPVPRACSCGTPNEANFYASGVILRDDATDELSEYLCAEHAKGHKGRVKSALGSGERLTEYKLRLLR